MTISGCDKEGGEALGRPAIVVSGTKTAAADTVRIGELRSGCRRLHVGQPITEETIRELRRLVTFAQQRGAQQVMVALEANGGELAVSEVERLSVALGDLALPVHVVPTRR